MVHFGEVYVNDNEEEDIVSQESALDIIKEAEDRGWYENQEGLLRRRLMEYNMYFNGKYDYYNIDQLEKLKKAVNYEN